MFGLLTATVALAMAPGEFHNEEWLGGSDAPAPTVQAPPAPASLATPDPETRAREARVAGRPR